MIRQDTLVVMEDLRLLKHPAERRLLGPKGSGASLVAPLRMEGAVKGLQSVELFTPETEITGSMPLLV